jgi:hypothetical protein
MAMRLMFSASTAIAPDLLVLDEVLGVGDAYFAQKSYDRMRELCDRNGATLLLVTHDIYTAVRMCNRVLWFERGVVAMDGGATPVVKAYEESIRAQEERRLRLKTQARLARRESPVGDDSTAPLLLEIHSLASRPQPCPVYFAGITLLSGDRIVAELPLGDVAFDPTCASHLVQEGGCWGDPVEWHGRGARPMLNYGSPFHKVGGVLAVPRTLLSTASDLKIVLDYWSDEACQLRLRCYLGEQSADMGDLCTAPGGWRTHAAANSLDGNSRSLDALLPAEAPGIQGTGTILVVGFAMVDAAGAEIQTVRHGEEVRFRIDYRIQKKGLKEKAQVFIVVSRNNTERVCKFMTNDLSFDEALAPAGMVEMELPRMLLGAGDYSVAVEIAAEGYIERGITKFFSVDPDVYHCLTHALDFTVMDSGWIGNGTVFEGEGHWSMTIREPAKVREMTGDIRG